MHALTVRHHHNLHMSLLRLRPMRVSCRQFTVPLAAVGVDFPFTWYLTPSSRTRRRTRPRRWADAIEELRAPAGGVPRLARGDARQHERLEDRRAPGRGVRARPRCSRRRPAPRLRPRLTCPAARRPVTRVFALGTVGAIDFAQNGRCEMQQPDIIHRPPPPPPQPPRPVPPRPPAPPPERVHRESLPVAAPTR